MSLTDDTIQITCGDTSIRFWMLEQQHREALERIVAGFAEARTQLTR